MYDFIDQGERHTTYVALGKSATSDSHWTTIRQIQHVQIAVASLGVDLPIAHYPSGGEFIICN